jgi:rhomboid family GlyGly-CTERM serine protease
MKTTRPRRGFTQTLKSLNCDGRLGAWLLVLCGLLLLPELAGDAGRAALRYERAGIAAGQWWRLLSGHLVHLDLEHAALNVLGVVLMWAVFARDYSPARWLAIVLASVALIDAGLWYRDRELAWYVGASGVLHGVMAAGTLAHLRRRDFEGWILLAFILGKLLYEQSGAALPFAAGGVTPVAVDAHLYGALGGVLAGALLRSREPAA